MTALEAKVYEALRMVARQYCGSDDCRPLEKLLRPAVLALVRGERQRVLVEAADNIRANRLARGAYSSNWEQGYVDGQRWSEDEVLMLANALAAESESTTGQQLRGEPKTPTGGM